MPRSGVIGEQIYDQVEKLVADGMNRTQAFAEISKQSGRQAGTVAANYYRVARKRAGGSLRKAKAAPARKPRATASNKGGRPRGSGSGGRRSAPAASGGDIDALAAQLVASVEALAAAVKAQGAEVSELRSRLDGVKKLLG
jgi:hypothetical protein